MDYLNLGQAPANEECSCVGEPDYPERSKVECRVWKHQLLRVFPVPNKLDGLVYYQVKSFDHDFGIYREVCIVYSNASGEAIDMAYKVENNLPSIWDHEAKVELATALKEAGLQMLEQQTA